MTSPDVSALLAQLGRLDNRPETIESMQEGLNRVWRFLDDVAMLQGWPE